VCFELQKKRNWFAKHINMQLGLDLCWILLELFQRCFSPVLEKLLNLQASFCQFLFQIFGGITEIHGDGRDLRNLEGMALMNYVTKCYT
jgi:hypothetical protein